MSYFSVVQSIILTSMDERKSLQYITKNILENRKKTNKQTNKYYLTLKLPMFSRFLYVYLELQVLDSSSVSNFFPYLHLPCIVITNSSPSHDNLFPRDLKYL